MRNPDRYRSLRTAAFTLSFLTLFTTYLLLQWHPERHHGWSIASLAVCGSTAFVGFISDALLRLRRIDNEALRRQAKLEKKKAALRRSIRKHRLFIDV